MQQKSAKTGLRFSGFLLTGLLFLIHSMAAAGSAPFFIVDEPAPQNTQAAQRYLTALLRNPRPGTAFEKVCAWHADRGSAGTFRNALLQFAIEAGAISGDSLPRAESPTAVLPAPDAATETLSLPAGTAGDAAVLLAGLLDLRHGEPQQATLLLARAAELRPQDPVTRWMLARALDQSDQSAAATAAFEAALALKPPRVDLAEIHRDYAECLQRQRQPDKALQVWQRLEQAFPGDRRVLRQVARALARDGRWADALTRFEQLSSTAGETEDRIAAELEVCEALQQLERSKESLTRLQSLLPELDPAAWLYRDVRARIEQLYRSSRDLADLAQHYETWLIDHPEDLDVMQRLARVLQELDRGEEARNWLTRALERAPGNTTLRNAMIAALQAEGRTADAALRLQQWLETGPADASQWQQLGLLQLSRPDLPPPDRQDLAATAFEKLAELAADDPRKLRQAAELLERAGRLERSEELLRTSLAVSPEDPAAREALGLFLHRRQRPSEALEVWNQLVAGPLKSPESLGQLADILQRNGFLQQAIQARREACSLNPELNDRLRFVELLLLVAEGGDAGAQQYFPEAIGQLDLADNAAAELIERERVLELRVRALLASDGLAAALQTERARISEKTSAGTVTAADYRRLCAFESAAGRISAAAAACFSAVQLEPTSIADRSLLVQLYERAGQTGDAAAALRELMELDRRGWSAYQQQLVRLEMRSGRPEAALEAASELTRAAPGSVEAWQFLAETAFAVGRATEGVEALRRAVRASPGDVTALRSLARTLADEFQTAEAVELTWRAFEQSTEDQERQELATLLSQLALRSGRWNAAHERLEQWQRIHPDALEAAQAMATFFREAGRFSDARTVLEPLLHADPENNTLLAELANLAERERRGDLAADYLLRLFQSTNSLQDLRRLLAIDTAILKQAGIDSTRLISDAAAETVARADFHALIQLVISRQRQPLAFQLCLERMERDRSDWWSLAQAARIAAQLAGNPTVDPTAAATQKDDAAAEPPLSPSPAPSIDPTALVSPESMSPPPPGLLRLHLLNLRLSPGSTAVVSQPANATPTGSESQRLWRQAAITTADAEANPTVFAEALIIAARDHLRAEGVRGIPLLFESAAFHRDGARFLQACFAAPAVDLMPTELLDAMLYWLDDRDEPAELQLRLTLLTQRFARARRFDSSAVQASLEQRMVTQALSILKTSPEVLTNRDVFDPRQLREASQNAWRGGLLRLVTENIPATDNPAARITLMLEQAVLLRDAELFGTVLNQLTGHSWTAEQQQPLRRVCEQPDFSAWVHEISDVSGLQQLLRFLLADAVWTDEPLSLRLLTTVQPGAIQFRHQASPASARERLISACLGRGLQLWRGTVEELRAGLMGDEQAFTPYTVCLLRAELQRQRAATDPLVRELATAAALNRSEWTLRLWLAELLPGMGLVDEALQLLTQLPRTDARAAIDAELLALNISLAADRLERARDAAVRLSGLPLSESQQQRLIPVLGRLNLPDILRSVEVRLGRSTETRTGVLARRLQSAQAAGDKQLAGEVAWELLRLSSGGSLFSGYRPTDDRDDGGERVLALRALAQCGRAAELVERYEAMLEAAPDALPLLELLAELDDAAGNREQLARRQDQIAALTGKVSPGRRRQAMELESAGNVSAACDVYLEILREDAATFSAEAETFFQAFERAKRRGDFLRAVLQLDAVFWRENGRLLSTATAAAATSMNSDAAGEEVVRSLVQQSAARLLAEADTRRHGLAMLMNLPGLLTDDQVQTGFLAELQRLEQIGQQSRAELLAACSELLQLAATLKRQELLRNVAASASQPGQSAAARVVRMSAAAQRGEATLVDQAVPLLLAEGESEFADSPDSLAELLLLLQQRLQGLGADWTATREQLLRQALAAGLGSVAGGEQLRGALAEILQQSGRSSEARQLLLSRLLSSTSTAVSLSAAGVRELLKTAEQLQYSGYPIEAAELLCGISPHDLQQFTKTLESDRASAFRSRWNAAVQWSIRQSTSEKLAVWLESQLDEAPAAAALQPQNRPQNSLLLIPDGPGDPAETNPQELLQLIIKSLMLDTVWRGEFGNAELRERIRPLVARVLERRAMDVGLVCAAVALADRADCLVERDLLITQLLATAANPGSPQPVIPANAQMTQGDEFAGMQVAGLVPLGERLLADGRIELSVAERLWDAAAAAAQQPGPRLVRLALLNRAAGAALRAGLTDAGQRYRRQANELISEQQRAADRANVATGTLAEVIRRLLNE
jgi:tetratricopeptide (TPR) repeat protein